MEKYNNDMEKMFGIINENSKNVLTKKQEAELRSINTSEIQYKLKHQAQKEKQKIVKIKLAITSMVLIGTMAISTMGSDKLTTFVHDHIYTPIVDILNDPIDKKIEDYQKSMDMYNDSTKSIETYLGRLDDESKVSYSNQNIQNLATHLTKASKKSEIDARCAVIAAYKIINEPYRDEVLGKAFLLANQAQEENIKYSIPTSTNEFLENLGYQNWEEYHKFERENIKQLKSLEENMEGKNR